VGDIRLAQREVALRQKEAAEAAPRAQIGLVAQPPLELPVPQGAGGARPAATPAAPTPGGASPARPTIIER
jgi:hypothetical protein